MIHMITYIIDLTQLKQFNIITYLKVDLFFIIHYLTYLIFLVSLFNQFFLSNFLINIY